MSADLENQKILLANLESLFQEGGLQTKLEEPDDYAPFYTLISRFANLGKEENFVVDLQLSFLPLVVSRSSDISSKKYLFQIFVEIIEEFNETQELEILKTINKINSKISTGSFGITGTVVYFKWNVMFDTNINLNLSLYTSLLESYCDCALFTIDHFIDTISQVSTTQVSATQALEINDHLGFFKT
ncbi:hypothetical protein NG798_00330 [Ancylothrix sp. C2]|uniref:hypothetical protein n=1 Tax=Ancylothrix sp. D3o TaxID=2953691 RepID=UPI0021BA6464|nr:hypothetical protein [Ancylothrix sp. D3o]MCT7948238.1 hypothetical protein [Ancylothrix sp. D3o]